ncbi:Transient receptor putative cation channel subfamily M member 2 [Cichlidogyrus casuarinus]|uniref:Transient receptor putative cation channel subfamily M member 2 n=1 Tax=Cichlidogyrus casuarinus TaxID=1844966 RepID=A0ABD2PVX0_9PLAT
MSSKPEDLPFNNYDEICGVSRKGLRHKVRLAKVTLPPCGSIQPGLPLNPYGRSGLIGRGLLPRWGPNHNVILDNAQQHSASSISRGEQIASILNLYRNPDENRAADLKVLFRPKKFPRFQIEEGTLNDHLNADHAWIEAVFLNMHQNPEAPFSDDFLEFFEEEFSDEKASWVRIIGTPGLRSSHEGLLASLLAYHKQFKI